MRKLIVLLAVSFALVSCRTDTVTKVVDGDTLVLASGEKVRLIGVDTPETKHPRKPVECYGPEASAFTKEFILDRDVLLAFDKEEQDRYGRTLAYVYRDDGAFLNAELIKTGHAKAYTRFPFKFKTDFVEHENEARRRHLGLWKECR